MEDTESEELCAHLTRTVANKPADEFYQEFNLISSSLSEYYFKEMKEIFHLPGMELWPKLMTLDSTKESHRSPPIYLSLVCFLGPSTLLPNSPNYKRVDIAHTKAHEMQMPSSPSLSSVTVILIIIIGSHHPHHPCCWCCCHHHQ
jgi:hypothetical protein